ncbi:hypothetical protein OHU45_31935 [Streptomyces tubercidicus]|uniref:hypothetical protein n=1 Tax=Streptomyces tubercidicus TaxID=47759 RepID=UPI0030E0A972
MRRLIAVPTVLFALAAAGCGDADGGPDTTAATSSPTGAGPGDGPGSASPTVPGQSVNCGELPDALGSEGDVTLFADPGAGGTVGCGEARSVMAEFFLRAPREAQDDRATLSVRGWVCQYESGPTGTWITTCRKDKREMHTEEPPGGKTEPGPSGEPGDPDESQLPPLPDESSDPLDEPSTEEL